MNPIGGLLKFFRKRAAQRLETEQINQRWLDGFDAFQKGRDLYFKRRIQEALDCFDEAIDCGYVEDADVYAMRGGCLQSLNFHQDAIDDFDRSIALESENSLTFFDRSLSKGATRDFRGQVSDLQEAIRLAGIDNADTRNLDAHAREKGYKNLAHYYESKMLMAKLDLDRHDRLENRYSSMQGYYKKTENMQRRQNVRRTGE
jgi:tetratricopeptide (TPR) repeat protein